MSLVAAKCPNCGASIMLDAGSQEGFCSYCGSKLKIQEVIQRVKIDKTGDVGNYLALAEVAYKGEVTGEAYEYANKVLELDSKNVKAWLLKLKVIETGTRLHFTKRAQEAIACGNKVIELDSLLAHNVYCIWLTIANNFLDARTAEIPNTSLYIEDFEVLEPQVMSLRRAVPTDQITNDAKLTKYTLDLAEAWGDYEYYANKYGNVIGYATLKKYQQCLDEILVGIPEEEKTNNPKFRIFYGDSSLHAQKQESLSQDNENKGCILMGVLIITIAFVVHYIVTFFLSH